MKKEAFFNRVLERFVYSVQSLDMNETSSGYEMRNLIFMNYAANRTLWSERTAKT